jgi:hypothetical protein
VANALAGKAFQAADYAAYAMVYGQGGYGAVADRESFKSEFEAGGTPVITRREGWWHMKSRPNPSPE